MNIKQLINIQKLSSSPGRLIVLSFAITILLGTILLLLPAAASVGKSIKFIDALFTATSATCVTGLIVKNTPVDFSTYGKIIILVLIQLGGLGIMTYSAFSVLLIRKRLSLRERIVISSALNQQDIKQLFGFIKSIIIFTLLIELVGTIFLYFSFSNIKEPVYRFAISGFHSISAFCNAGFSLFEDSFVSYKSNVHINLTICILIVLGGIGFPVLYDLWKKIFNMIKIRKETIVRLSLNSKIAIIGSSILIIFGTLIIYGFEHPNHLWKLPTGTQWLSAFFQSITLRTAGFNTINISNLSISTYIIMIIYMFIGACSGSTGGGVKVNTFTVVLARIKSMLQNKDDTIINKKAIPSEVINKSFSIISLSITFILVSIIILTRIENFNFIQIIFETFSAFGTVGLSTGITPHLSTAGKIIIILLMFTGRIGPLTMVVAIQKREQKYKISYPHENIAVG